MSDVLFVVLIFLILLAQYWLGYYWGRKSERRLKKHHGPVLSSKEMDAVLKDAYSNAADLKNEPSPLMRLFK